ncbi:MAG: hypothetical protein HKN31_00505 [Pricia sp.]|nr:hypothetical protein [Pricia sp.]
MLAKKNVGRIFVSSMVFLFVGIIYFCKNPKLESDYYKPKVLATHFNGEQYVGSETCMECHADIYSTHIKTAHYNTSALADEKTLLGSFEHGFNVLDLEYVTFTMERQSDSFFKHTLLKNRTKKILPSAFNIVIGSGVRGQSYLTWDDNKLFQLQPSYYTPDDTWVNSPGYPQYYLERPIRGACLKCHFTFATNQNPGQGNQYDRTKMVFGVDCEKCHRPSAKHVNYHRKNPEATTAKFMLQIDTLSRKQRLDACAQCHSGPRSRQLKGFPFSFLPGDDLNEYSRNIYTGQPSADVDVHGNQYNLLVNSECFKQTESMTCITCHDPHKNQRGNTAHFNQKCMECHSGNATICAAETFHGDTAANDCIACHMPITPSQSMTVQLTETDSLETSFYIRTHLIKVYPEQE